MKNLLFLIFIAFFGISTAVAQGHFKIGVNGGIPVGDIDDYATFQLGADVAYMFNVVEALDLGPLVGYSNYFGDEINTGLGKVDLDDIQFLPIAASARYGLTEAFFLGADLGYAVGLDDGNDGGFYYRPQIGYNFGIIGIVASYSGVVVDGDNIASVNLGIEFGF